MSFLSKYSKEGAGRLKFNHSEEYEYDDKRFRPGKVAERLEKLISRLDPAQIATRFLNSFMPDPVSMIPGAIAPPLSVTPITANDITVTGYAVTTTVQSAGSNPYAAANLEVGFDLIGTAYQSLINGMLIRANATGLQTGTPVDPQATYRVEFGFSIVGMPIGFNRIGYGWQGAFQVFDSITGQERGSMAYGWTGEVTNPSNPGELLALIVASGTRPSTTGATFYQPLATNAWSQQVVAEEYVQNFIQPSPSNFSHTWPPNNGNGNAFDPIPGNALFAPTSFPVA
jgi:hypothetical protein